MHGDFSRLPNQHDLGYSRVLFQQDRPNSDVDLNIAVGLVTDHMRQFFRDIIGPYGTEHGNSEHGNAKHANFAISLATKDPETGVDGVIPTVGKGFYYVQGFRCNHDPRTEAHRIDPDDPSPIEDFKTTDSVVLLSNEWFHGPPVLKPPFLVYLRVWERDVTALQDDRLRDPALNGRVTDTTTRTQVVWQVVASRHMPNFASKETPEIEALESLISGPPSLEKQDVKITDVEITDVRQEDVEKQDVETDTVEITTVEIQIEEKEDLEKEADQNTFVDCWREWEKQHARSAYATIDMDRKTSYSPTQNLLYRVEVVERGKANATFVWSRNNGCAQFRVINVSGNTVTVGAAHGLVGAKPEKGQVVELLSPIPTPPRTPRMTAEIEEVQEPSPTGDQTAGTERWDITLKTSLSFCDWKVRTNVLRLWDGRFRAQDAAEAGGCSLDDNVVVRILNLEDQPPYIEGDHWALATRGSENLDIDEQPRIVEDCVAPLALIRSRDIFWDLRSTFYKASMWNLLDRA